MEAYTNMQYGMTKKDDKVEKVVDHSNYISCRPLVFPLHTSTHKVKN